MVWGRESGILIYSSICSNGREREGERSLPRKSEHTHCIGQKTQIHERLAHFFFPSTKSNTTTCVALGGQLLGTIIHLLVDAIECDNPPLEPFFFFFEYGWFWLIFLQKQERVFFFFSQWIGIRRSKKSELSLPSHLPLTNQTQDKIQSCSLCNIYGFILDHGCQLVRFGTTKDRFWAQ